MNRDYKATPHEQYGGRELDYSRGKCLGRSSAIKFGMYTVGASDDYDQ